MAERARREHDVPARTAGPAPEERAPRPGRPAAESTGDRLDGAAAWAAGEVRDGRALHRLVAELDAEQREALRRVALVVLRPHALEAGVGAAVVRHLAEDLGAWPVALRVLARPDPALVGALYSRQPKIPRGRMWLQQAAFAQRARGRAARRLRRAARAVADPVAVRAQGPDLDARPPRTTRCASASAARARCTPCCTCPTTCAPSCSRRRCCSTGRRSAARARAADGTRARRGARRRSSRCRAGSSSRR